MTFAQILSEMICLSHQVVVTTGLWALEQLTEN